MIIIDSPNPEDHLRTEWLLTNGLGGYAMGTVLGVNTRRYHGLLVAATKPPVGRVVALHSMIEQLVIPRGDGSEAVIDLSTQMFVDANGEPMLHPDGWKRLKSFELDQCGNGARWTYQIDEVIVERSLGVTPHRDATEIVYTCSSDSRGVRLRVRPLVAMRNFHDLRTDNREVSFASEGTAHSVVIDAGSGSVLMRPTNSCEWTWNAKTEVWRQFAYCEEKERGLPFCENIGSPGYLEFQFGLQAVFGIACSCSDEIAAREEASEHTGHARKLWRLRQASANPPALAACDFVVKRCSGASSATSVIAGYPWFADWGRDAMISLPGLLLTSSRFDEALSVLHTFASHIRHGLVPNRFDDDGGEPYYNTVDASLWFVHAVWQLRRCQPSAVSRQLVDACRAIIHAYGNRIDFEDNRSPELSFAIRMDSDGLISAGDDHTQLTWMDAKRDGVIFTPRHGKAVEINALWFNALHCFAEMSEDKRESTELNALASRVRRSFRDTFWWEEQTCLHDVLLPTDEIRDRKTGRSYESDEKLRPNQIFAVSLPFSPLTDEQKRAVVECVSEKFLTPFGLRTLDRDDPQYEGRYEGNLFERDRAYHNGTAWPWLIGPYCEALMRLDDFSNESKREARRVIQPLLDEMAKTSGPRCLGQIAEIYDGDEPQRPQGCTAQAWSVAEVMRILAMVTDSA